MVPKSLHHQGDRVALRGRGTSPSGSLPPRPLRWRRSAPCGRRPHGVGHPGPGRAWRKKICPASRVGGLRGMYVRVRTARDRDGARSPVVTIDRYDGGMICWMAYWMDVLDGVSNVLVRYFDFCRTEGKRFSDCPGSGTGRGPEPGGKERKTTWKRRRHVPRFPAHMYIVPWRARFRKRTLGRLERNLEGNIGCRQEVQGRGRVKPSHIARTGRSLPQEGPAFFIDGTAVSGNDPETPQRGLDGGRFIGRDVHAFR